MLHLIKPSLLNIELWKVPLTTPKSIDTKQTLLSHTIKIGLKTPTDIPAITHTTSHTAQSLRNSKHTQVSQLPYINLCRSWAHARRCINIWILTHTHDSGGKSRPQHPWRGSSSSNNVRHPKRCRVCSKINEVITEESFVSSYMSINLRSHDWFMILHRRYTEWRCRLSHTTKHQVYTKGKQQQKCRFKPRTKSDNNWITRLPQNKHQ